MFEKESAVNWEIACTDSSYKMPQTVAIRQNPDGHYKLGHSEADRWAMEGLDLDQTVKAQGYSTYSILHVTFGKRKIKFAISK
jgi:hypothetical protein